MLISIDDVRDDLVYPVLKNADVKSVDAEGIEIITNVFMNDLNEYAEDFVMSIAGVGLNEIVNPAPYKFKELCKAKVCQIVCLAKSYSASLATRNSESKKDSWSDKLSYYTVAVKSLESQVTKEMLLGDNNQTILFGSVQMLRG